MLSHNKELTTISRKQIENRKMMSHNIFKSTLFTCSSIVMVFAITIILLVFVKGFKSSFDIDGLIWGDTFNGTTLFASGFMVVNTLWTTFLAILIVIPISTLTAIFITRVAPNSLRTPFFVILSILAAIPSVVYGAFGSRVIDWFVMSVFGSHSGTLLTIIITFAFMIMPTITLITTTSINIVDKRLEESSLALGATRNQTSYYVTLRAASTGILTAIILGVGRAIGEATAVSMISVDPYGGPTFGLLENIRLLTSTMLKGYNEMDPGSIQMESMFAMGMLLIVIILFVFISLRIIQHNLNEETKSNKASKKIKSINKIQNYENDVGFENMECKMQKKYIKMENKHIVDKEVEEYFKHRYRKHLTINKTTIKKTNIEQKLKKSKNLGILTWAMASIGVILLVSIILFLSIQGVSSLSWHYLTTTEICNIDGVEVNGLKSAIYGTTLLIALSLIMIFPLGVGTGIYFATFLKDTKFGKILNLSVDVLAGIPSLIFGLIGATLFLPISTLIGFAPLGGALILTLIVTPTVVQTTKEAIKGVPQEMIKGSLALGSTKTTSSLKISLPVAMPQIIAGVVLSIGRIIGESAAIVMIFGTATRGSLTEWTHFGGTTLSTEMYRLTLLEDIPWSLVSAIGLVIVSIILILSLLSNYISNKNKIGTLGMTLSIILMLCGVFTGILLIFIIGIIIFITTIILVIILNKTKGSEY